MLKVGPGRATGMTEAPIMMNMKEGPVAVTIGMMIGKTTQGIVLITKAGIALMTKGDLLMLKVGPGRATDMTEATIMKNMKEGPAAATIDMMTGKTAQGREETPIDTTKHPRVMIVVIIDLIRGGLVTENNDLKNDIDTSKLFFVLQIKVMIICNQLR